MPVGAAPLRGVVERVPQRPDHVDMARMLALFRRRERQLCRIKMMDRAVLADKDVQDRLLIPVLVLSEVVAIETVVRRRQKTDAPPTALAPETLDALGWRFCDGDEACALADMFALLVERIDNGRAAWAGFFHLRPVHETVHD